jgi:hypothetical protein
MEILCLGEHVDDEIAAVYVMGEVAEEMAAERIISHVLHDGTAVDVSVRLEEVRRSCVRKALQEDGLDGIFPIASWLRTEQAWAALEKRKMSAADRIIPA